MPRTCFEAWMLLAALPLLCGLVGWYAIYETWPDLALLFSGQAQVWFMRTAPGLSLLIGPLVGLCLTALLPLHRRRPVAMSGLLSFLIIGGFYAWREYARLAPYHVQQNMVWSDLTAYLDASVVAGGILGFM